MLNIALLLVFGAAIVLTLLSAWTYSAALYYLIVALFAAGFAIDIIGSYVNQGGWDWKAIVIDAWVFGFLLYFLTVQKVTGRRITAVTSGDSYKAFLVERNAFTGFAKFIYYLPIALIVAGVAAAAYWKFAG